MKQNKNIKENPFKVPENYFDELPSKIQERIDAKRSVPGKTPRVVLYNPRVLVAASFALIIGLASMLFFLSDNKGVEVTDQVVQEDFTIISDYLLTDLSDDEIIQVFEEWDAYDDYELLIPSEEPTEQEVIDYLLQEDHIEYYLFEELKNSNYENINLQIRLLFGFDHSYNPVEQSSYSSRV